MNLFVLPATSILLSGDQLFFWMNGQRMLYGEIPYRDFFQFTPPGADLVYFAVFQAFGPRIWAVNAVVLILGVALCWVSFEIASCLMRPGAAVLSTWLFLALIYSRLLNATHHFFSILAVMGAVAILMRGIDARRLSWAGALLGVASFFTQTHAIVALLAIVFFLREDSAQSGQAFWKRTGYVLLAFSIVVLALNAYFIEKAGLGRMLYCQVYYVFRVMVHKPEISLLGLPELRWFRGLTGASLAYEYAQFLFVYAMLPVASVLALRRTYYARGHGGMRLPEVAVLSITGAALLVEVVFSLNWLRLYAVSMAGVILFVYWIEQLKGERYLKAAMAIAIASLAVQRIWSAQQHDWVVADLPAGRAAIDRVEYEKLDWLEQHAPLGEFVFDANWPGVYIPLGVRNPVFLDTAGTVLNPVWDQQAAAQLESRRVRFVFWADRFDRMIGRSASHISPLRTYLYSNYRPLRVFSNGEQVWERK